MTSLIELPFLFVEFLTSVSEKILGSIDGRVLLGNPSGHSLYPFFLLEQAQID